ncbi:MAG: hypothetical protein NT045_00975 [Candidatus Aureabacteria bacterium]|nr:hypothetical protein [Candidatus Auribacterota bacterium]
MPMKDAIEQVLHAEADGKKLLAQARLKTDALLNDTEAQARETVARAVRDATEQARRVREEARQQSEAQRLKAVADVEQRLKEEARRRGGKIAEAVQKAFEMLLP